MTEPRDDIDLLVLGGGMAGLSAAARAASEGASIVLVEKGAAIGGSAAYAGFIWTAPTVEVMHEVNPDGHDLLAEDLDVAGVVLEAAHAADRRVGPGAG
jgi:succinate dehydrogenase/fumarate reductase flavoprotein subunit